MERRTLPLVFAALAACAGDRAEVQIYEFEHVRASYHDYARTGACEAERHWVFDELTSVNQLLQTFLERCGAREGADEKGLQLLRSVLPTLPAVVAAHAANLQAVALCPYAKEGLFPELLQKGNELVAQSNEYLSRAPALLAFGQTAEALVRWKEGLLARQEESKKACAKAPPRTVYFAWRDETLKTFWQFCDGAKVSSGETADLTFSPPDGATPEQQKALKGADYVFAAKQWPDNRVDKAPR